MGEPGETKKNNIGRIEWKSDTKFWAFSDKKPNRKMVFNRDGSDQKWYRRTRKNRKIVRGWGWHITVKSGYQAYGGAASACSTANNQFAGPREVWEEPKDDVKFLEKCGNSVNKQCEGQTITMDDEGWQ